MKYYATADDYLNETDDAIAEAAAFRRHPRRSGREAWHRMLVASACAHGVWARVEPDGRIHVSDLGSRRYRGTFDNFAAAIAFIDTLPLWEKSHDKFQSR